MATEEKAPSFVLPDKLYDFLKKLVQVILPAAASAYFALAAIWDLPNTKQVVGSISVVATFLGVIIGISHSQFQKGGADGTVGLISVDDQTSVKFNVDPHDLVGKKSITLKVKPHSVTHYGPQGKQG